MNINKLTGVLYKSDCLALLERVPSGQVTLCYFDPPWYTNYSNHSHIQRNNKSNLDSYLTFLSHVLQQTRRVLSEDGSLFFHSTPSLAGSIRSYLDSIFGVEQFRQEIIIQSSSAVSNHRFGAALHEVIYIYSKGDHPKLQPVTRRLTDEEIAARFPKVEGNRRYRLVNMLTPIQRPTLQYEWKGYTPNGERSWSVSLSEMKRLYDAGELDQREYGRPAWRKRYLNPESDLYVPLSNIWTERTMTYVPGSERAELSNGHRYTAQRPLELMERIIRMGSEKGDVVLDAFAGSGSTLVAARKLERTWIGGDVLEEAVELARIRLAGVERLPSNGPKILDQARLEELYAPHSINYRYIETGFAELKGVKDTFYLHQTVPFEETRYCEFKEVKGDNPIRTIKNDVDNYVTAFLNSSGGRIFWGIANTGKVTGVKLRKTERDRLRKDIDSKLGEVKPRVDPTQYHVEIHDVHENFQIVPDCVVVEVVVPKAETLNLYALGDGSEALVKTDSGKRKMTVAEIVDWARRRMPQSRLDSDFVDEDSADL